MIKVQQLTIIVLTLAIMGCGNNSDLAGSSNLDISGTGKPTQGISSGPISGFGSIIVNGIRYNTTNADIIIDGISSSESDIALGQTVTITSTPPENSEATASIVNYEALIEGQITAVDDDAETLEVLGVNIIISNDTIEVGYDFSLLTNNDFLEVSGSYDSAGNLHASYIALIPTQVIQELNAVINTVNGNQVQIGRLSINTSQASFTPSNLDLTSGIFVEIEGSFINNQFNATQVTQKTPLSVGTSEVIAASIEGYINNVNVSSFTIQGLAIQFDNNTRFINGTSADITKDNEAIVQGTISEGILTASEIVFELESELEIAGAVESVDTINRTITILGLSVTIPLDTLIQDERDKLKSFSINDITIGDFIEIEIAEDSNSELIALILKREDDEAEFEIKGPIQSLNQTTNIISIFNISIDLSSPTLEIESDNISTLTEFYATVAVGDIIEVKGAPVGNLFNAIKIEL